MKKLCSALLLVLAAHALPLSPVLAHSHARGQSLLVFSAVQKGPTQAADKATEKVTWVKEPDTKVRFPNHMQSDVTKKKMRLAGVAVRDKRFVILVNVYAYALYVQDDAIAKELSAFHAKPSASLQGDQKFFDALGKDAIPRTMRLQFVRGVGAKKIRNAFVDSVEPRIARAAKKHGWTDGTQALAKFRAYFGNKVKDGQVIEFTWLPGHKLTTKVAGKNMGTITSKALSWALWDTYFGSDPIESKGKKNAVKELAQRLAITPKAKPIEKKDKATPAKK